MSINDYPMDKLEADIVRKLTEWNLLYVSINKKNIAALHKLFFENIIDNDNTNGDYLFYLAVYYEYHLKDMRIAKKCYRLASDAGSASAMHNLGCIYGDRNKYTKAEKYYQMAINAGCVESYSNLGHIYKMQHQYELAKNTMLMGVERGSVFAPSQLASIYRAEDKNDLAEKYYLIAIARNNRRAIKDLAQMYFDTDRFDLGEKYMLMAIEKGDIQAIYKLGQVYDSISMDDDAEKYYLMAIEKNVADAIIPLAKIYYRQKKYLLAGKYYLKSAVTNNTYAIAMVNEIVEKSSDIAYAMEAEPFLTRENKQYLAKVLEYIEENSTGNFNGRLIDGMECAICDNFGYVLFMHCSHPVCIKCFRAKNACRICNTLSTMENNDSDDDDSSSDNDNDVDNDDASDEDHHINNNNDDQDNEEDIAFTLPDIIYDRLANKLSQWKVVTDPIPEDQLIAIYKIFFHNVIDDNNDSDIYKLYLGIYYHCQRRSDLVAERHYLAVRNNTALVNMGLLYERSKFIRTAEEYYYEAIQNNSSDANANYYLAELLSRQRLPAVEYYLTAALNYHTGAREKINRILHKRFDVIMAIECESFLDRLNTYKLNHVLAYVYETKKLK